MHNTENEKDRELGKNSWLAIDLPVTDYHTLWNTQKKIAEAKANNKKDEDVIFFTEHYPIFTIGKSGKIENLLVTEKFLADLGIKIERVERGGDITYHAEGQLIVYPIINLKKNKTCVKDYVFNLEELMIRTILDLGIKAYRDNSARGAWVNGKKIGSVGIAIKKEITYHGLALNVNLPLEPFKWINPCGLKAISMTSIAKELDNSDITAAQTKEIMRKHLENIFNITLHNY